MLFAVLLSALVGQMSKPMATPIPTPDPVAIYRSALKRLSTLAQPAYIDTTMHWKVLADGPGGAQGSVFDERVLFDSTARRECVLFVPYTPESRVIIGQSYFAPDMWLIRKPPVRQPQTTHPDFSPDLSDLKTIAAVVSTAKPSYDIALAGTAPLTNSGGSAYHLVLKPLSDPWKRNLRELWVNSTNLNVVRAVLVGDYRPDYGQLLEQTTVAEDFGQVGPYWVVIHHTWSYRDAPNAISFQYDATAKNMSFPTTIPAWYFDEADFARHRSDVNTSLSWP